MTGSCRGGGEENFVNLEILTKFAKRLFMESRDFLKFKGAYRNLIAVRKAECIYDVTYYFVHNYFGAGDRTIDQMLQAARSGKQNIIEGRAAATTSLETELKLLNVARASFQELLADYEDYLRVHGLELWDPQSPKALQTRDVCRKQNDSSFYRQAITERSDETIANIAIVLIHQTDFLVMQLFNKSKKEFLQWGGLREEMTRVRFDRRKKRNPGNS